MFLSGVKLNKKKMVRIEEVNDDHRNLVNRGLIEIQFTQGGIFAKYCGDETEEA